MVSAGERHTMALDSTARVHAWGSDQFGQSSTPPSVREAFKVSAGGYHSAALRADGSVACWGWNISGQCDVPVGLRRAVDIAAGFAHTAVLDETGSVRVWGDNAYQQANSAGITGLSRALVSGYWSLGTFPAECTEAPVSPTDCACGPFMIDSNLDEIADCISLRFGDLDLDGIVGPQDLAVLLANWGAGSGALGDLNRDGTVGPQDVALLLNHWAQGL
jgi:hypothetical protein